MVGCFYASYFGLTRVNVETLGSRRTQRYKLLAPRMRIETLALKGEQTTDIKNIYAHYTSYLPFDSMINPSQRCTDLRRYLRDRLGSQYLDQGVGRVLCVPFRV